MNYLFLSLGAGILFITGLDILATVLVPSGAGPLTTLVTRFLAGLPRLLKGKWETKARGLLGGLSLAGISAFWIVLLWFGWWLLFSADPSSIISVSEETSADSWEKVYYTGYMFFTLGVGDFVPINDFWRLLTALGSCCGLFVVTLSITYLMPVLGAANEKLRLSEMLANLGDSPQEILRLHWDGEGFERLVTRLDNVIWPELQLHAQRHLAYPILYQFLSAEPENSLAVRLAALNDALTILAVAVIDSQRPHPSVTEIMFRAIDDYLDILESEFTNLRADSPELPELKSLAESGIIARWNETRYSETLRRRRARLAAFAESSGCDASRQIRGA